LDLYVLEQNIATAANRASQKNINLRPHCKSHKSIEIAKLQIKAGASGISCATLGEAEIMASAGISGILITSPIVSANKIARLLVLNQQTDHLMVVVDNIQNIETLAQANKSYNKPLNVLVDFDVGQKRTGAKTIEEAMSLVLAIGNTSTLKLVGLQAYGGHLQHVVDFSERQALIRAQNSTIKKLSEQMRPHSTQPMIITGGGTGTFSTDLSEGIFTELQIGSYIFMDVQYNEVRLTEDSPSPFYPSLFVLSSVVSTNNAFAIVDAGLKCFATDGPKPSVFSGTSQAATYQFMGDEHGKIIQPDQNSQLPLGHVLQFITPHCDPTVNLYDFYHCVRGNTLVDIWSIEARGSH
jgi:D-serine deaminase-like pyridoxal phosphate-dependent protein